MKATLLSLLFTISLVEVSAQGSLSTDLVSSATTEARQAVTLSIEGYEHVEPASETITPSFTTEGEPVVVVQRVRYATNRAVGAQLAVYPSVPAGVRVEARVVPASQTVVRVSRFGDAGTPLTAGPASGGLVPLLEGLGQVVAEVDIEYRFILEPGAALGDREIQLDYEMVR